MTASAVFHINALAPGAKASVSSGGAFTATPESQLGVDSHAWVIEGTDETAGTWSLSSSSASTISGTAPSGSGKSAILRHDVNGGDGSPNGHTYRVKLYIAPEVGAINETFESDATYGWCAFVNPLLRLFGASSTNPTITAPSGGYVSIFESTTEVARILDDGGTRSITFQGAVAAEVESGGNLNLVAASGSNVSLYEGAAEVARFFDNSTVSTVSFPGALGAYMQVLTASQNFSICSGTGGSVRLREDTTDVAWFDDNAGVARISGRGASGTSVEANAAYLRLQCASGSEVRIGESTTDVCYMSDVGGLATIQGRGGSGSVFSSSAAHVLLQGATFVGLQSDAGQIQFNASSGVIDFYGASTLRRKLTLGVTTTDNMSSGVTYQLQSNGTTRFSLDGTGIGFYATAPIAKPTVSGSRANPEAALANLLTALSNLGLLTNSTSA